MSKNLARDTDGRIRISSGKEHAGRVNGKILAMGLAVALTAIALSGIGVALAEGDKNQLTHGEDDGYYDDNNCNPYDDIPFPGEDIQNRTGVV